MPGNGGNGRTSEGEAGAVPVVAIVILLVVAVASSATVYAWATKYRLHGTAPAAIGFGDGAARCGTALLVTGVAGFVPLSALRIVPAGDVGAYSIALAGRVSENAPWSGEGLDGALLAGESVEIRAEDPSASFHVVHVDSSSLVATIRPPGPLEGATGSCAGGCAAGSDVTEDAATDDLAETREEEDGDDEEGDEEGDEEEGEDGAECAARDDPACAVDEEDDLEDAADDALAHAGDLDREAADEDDEACREACDDDAGDDPACSEPCDEGFDGDADEDDWVGDDCDDFAYVGDGPDGEDDPGLAEWSAARVRGAVP